MIIMINYLRTHVGGEELQLPVDTQVQLDVPTSSYPVSQEYLAVLPTKRESILTSPLVGKLNSSHWPAWGREVSLPHSACNIDTLPLYRL